MPNNQLSLAAMWVKIQCQIEIFDWFQLSELIQKPESDNRAFHYVVQQ